MRRNTGLRRVVENVSWLFVERATILGLNFAVSVWFINYLGAAHLISELSDKLGDREQAYEALAVGWVVLAQQLGEDLAEASFKGKLEKLRESWGQREFEEVRLRVKARLRRDKEREQAAKERAGQGADAADEPGGDEPS